MVISGTKTLSWFLGASRFKRSKSDTLIVFSAIALAITFTLGITVGTKYLQSTIVLADLDSVITDISIGVSLPEVTDQADMNSVTDALNQLSSVDNTIIKQHTRDRYRGDGELVHEFGIDTNATSTFDRIDQSSPNILSFDSDDFRSYVEVSNIRMQKHDNALLTLNTTIISPYLARKCNVTINDTIFLHYFRYPGWYISNEISNKSFPLKITNILSVPSESQEAKELLRSPFLYQTEGRIRELLIVESATFLNLLESLMGDYRGIVTSQFVVSLFLHREPIIDSYNTVKSPSMLGSIETEVVNTLQKILPQGSVLYTQNLLLEELRVLEADISSLQQTLTVVSLPVICLVLGITLLSRIISINNQIRQYGVWICRGVSKNDLKNAFLIEGAILGVFAAIGGVLSSLVLISSLYFIIPNDKNFFQWLYVFINNLPSIGVNSLFLGIIIGVSLNYIVSRNVMKIQPIETVQQYRSGITRWFIEKRKNVRWVIFPLAIIVTIWMILRIISLIGFLGMFQLLFQLSEDIPSLLLSLLPILIVLLLILIITNRRDLFAKYMISFSFPLNLNVQEIMRLNYLRRPKHFSNLAFLTAIAFSMGIAPIMLSQSAHDVSIRQIKREVGSDIRITGTYEQLKPVTPSTFHNLSSHIEAVTPMIWVDSDILVNFSYKDNGYQGTGTEHRSTGVLAIQPENFVEVSHFEDCFTPDNQSNELFSQLRSDVATAVAPICYKNYEISAGEYVEHDIGSVIPIRFSFTNGESVFAYFTVIGFFYLIPGFTQKYFNPPTPLICSIDYLESLNITQRLFSISSKEPLMSWLIKIDPQANDAIRERVFHVIHDYFQDSEVFFLDDVVRSFLTTPTGSIVIIMDTMFFMVLMVTIFGLGLVFFQTFRERRTEVAIYRSRGMKVGDINTMFLFEVLSLDVLGAIFGVTIGFVTSLTYTDALINPHPVIPVYMFFPGVKIILFLGILAVTHILMILGLSYWSTRQSILGHLRVRD